MVEKDLLYQSKASQNTGQQQQERAQDAGQLQGYGGKREDSQPFKETSRIYDIAPARRSVI